jgi:hypothetical protein
MAMDAPEHSGVAGKVDEDCGRVARELGDRVVRQDRVVVSRPSDERPVRRRGQPDDATSP